MGCRVFRVGVFFDGTGNNKFVDSKAGDGSASNVAKLYELYNEHHGEVKTKLNKPLYTAKIYKEGIGTDKTRDDWYDDFWDRKSEKGAGGGGAKRIQEAIDSVTELLSNHSPGSGSADYCERIIDVFGFSRGAAQARDFINTFSSVINEQGLIKVKFGFVGIYDTVGSFGKAGNRNNMKPIDPTKDKENAISFWKLGNGFYGLEDHVNDTRVTKRKSFGHYTDIVEADRVAKQQHALLSADGGDWRVKLVPVPSGSMYSPPSYSVRAEKHEKTYAKYNFNLAKGSATKIVHMTADDEVRKSFPLSSLLPIGIHEEFAFLGVHSDIGGGYADTEIEPHSYHLKTFKGPWGTGMSGDFSAMSDAKKYEKIELKKLKDSGDAAKGWKTKIKVDYNTFRPNEYSVFVVQKRKIGNDLSKITLCLMHDRAVSAPADVPLKALPSDKAHSVSNDLQKYFEYCKDERHIVKWNYAEHKSFIKFSLPENMSYFQSVDENYRHHSAVDPAEAHSHYDGHTGLWNKLIKDSPDGGDGNDVRYIGENNNGGEIVVDPRKTKYAGKLTAKRAIYPNIEKMAIVAKNT